MTTNQAASVRQRLLNLAKAEGKRFNDVFQLYALERWLYRLSCSPYAERFILKGALLFVAWRFNVSRPTRDIDLLARADNDLERIKEIIAEVCQVAVVDDGMSYDPDSVVTERISEDALYEGVRATFLGYLGKARAPMQIDLGFSDVVTPEPVEIDYPTALDMPAPYLKAYNRETAIAEKFEAMVKLGELNSRMKDFFDLWVLARNHSFEGETLAHAVRQTFSRRGTVLSEDAVCFNPDFGRSPVKQAPWQAFLKRSNLQKEAPESFEKVWETVIEFLRPTISSAMAKMHWEPGGRWSTI